MSCHRRLCSDLAERVRTCRSARARSRLECIKSVRMARLRGDAPGKAFVHSSKPKTPLDAVFKEGDFFEKTSFTSQSNTAKLISGGRLI